MSDISPSQKAKVAPGEPRAAPVKPDQLGDDNTAEEDIKAMFKKTRERVDSMTPEERKKQFPWLQRFQPGTVGADVAMKVLEMEADHSVGETETAGVRNTTS